MRYKENKEFVSQTASRVSAPPEEVAEEKAPSAQPATGWPQLLLCYDLETTGLREAQIVQMAAFMMRATEDGKVERVGDMFLTHIMPSKAIDPGASKVHLIKMSKDKKGLIGRNGEDLHAKPVREGLQELLDYITKHNPSKARYLMFGYNNLRFDDPVLRNEFQRAGMGSAVLEGTGCAGSTDLLVAIRKHEAMKKRFPRGSRKLTDVYAVILGKDLNLAHDASGDVEGVIQVMEGDVDLTKCLIELPIAEFAFETVAPKGDPGDKVISFGKHKGLTFRELSKQQKGYCTWVMSQEDASPSMQALIDYLRKHLCGSADVKAMVVPFGKHKGRTYEDVAANEADYCQWVMSQESPSGNMKAFQNFLAKREEDGLVGGLEKLAV